MTESWRDPGPWDDSLRHRRSWSTSTRHRLRTPAPFDPQTWLHLVDLLDGVEAHDRSEVDHAMGTALALPRGRLIALKQALRIGIWCTVTAVVPEPITDDALDELAGRIAPEVDTLLNVPTGTLAAVMGDALRIMAEQQPSYSVPDGEFVLVATVVLAELLALAPAAVDLDAIHDQCQLAFSTTDTTAVREAWLARLAT